MREKFIRFIIEKFGDPPLPFILSKNDIPILEELWNNYEYYRDDLLQIINLIEEQDWIIIRED